MWNTSEAVTSFPPPGVPWQLQLRTTAPSSDLRDDGWLTMPLRDSNTTNIWAFSTKDGAPRQLTDFGQRSTLIARQVSWSRDGRSVYAAVVETDSDIVLLDGLLR